MAVTGVGNSRSELSKRPPQLRRENLVAEALFRRRRRDRPAERAARRCEALPP